jgi:Putative neutral zinc metallopeptidase
MYAYSKDSTIPRCGGFASPYLLVQMNAFYCPESDFIAWDDQGLFPQLNARYGTFLLSIVLAHEWGHAIQKRERISFLDGVTLEQQSDCFAGSWAASLSETSDPELFALRNRELDRSLAGFVEFRDRLGMTAEDFGAHGTAFDRIRAFQDGYRKGAAACAAYEDHPPVLVAVPYRSFKERFRGGNLPYEEIVDSLRPRMDSFWRHDLAAASAPGVRASGDLAFCSAPLFSPEGFTDDTLSWCADDNVITYSDTALRKVYDEIGDFGVATEIALTWAVAHEVEVGSDPSRKAVWLRAVCAVGAWTGSMYQPDDPQSSLLSPGDVDEGVRALLENSAKGSRSRYGTGFEQVAAFRTGVLGSARACHVPVPS